ncbi:hypothetical protein BC936DRAFT_144989, partial [Jimgerdemannia flammicorona]
DNSIGDEGARALAESLKQNTTLITLNLKEDEEISAVSQNHSDLELRFDMSTISTVQEKDIGSSANIYCARDLNASQVKMMPNSDTFEIVGIDNPQNPDYMDLIFDKNVESVFDIAQNPSELDHSGVTNLSGMTNIHQHHIYLNTTSEEYYDLNTIRKEDNELCTTHKERNDFDTTHRENDMNMIDMYFDFNLSDISDICGVRATEFPQTDMESVPGAGRPNDESFLDWIDTTFCNIPARDANSDILHDPLALDINSDIFHDPLVLDTDISSVLSPCNTNLDNPLSPLTLDDNSDIFSGLSALEINSDVVLNHSVLDANSNVIPNLPVLDVNSDIFLDPTTLDTNSDGFFNPDSFLNFPALDPPSLKESAGCTNIEGGLEWDLNVSIPSRRELLPS